MTDISCDILDGIGGNITVFSIVANKHTVLPGFAVQFVTSSKYTHFAQQRPKPLVSKCSFSNPFFCITFVLTTETTN